MKRVVNEQVSKRPQPVPDDADLRTIEEQREKLEAYISKLRALASAVDSEPGITLTLACYDRLRQIERRRMFIPVTDVTAHAEIVGQWNECLRITVGQIGDDENFVLTKGREGVKGLLVKSETMLEAVLGRLSKLKEALSKSRESGD